MFAVTMSGDTVAVHVAHRHSARLVGAGSVSAHPFEAAAIVPVDRVRPTVPVCKHEVRVPVAVEVRGDDIDGRVVPGPEWRSLAEGPRAIPMEDEVLAGPVDHQDVGVPVAVQIRERQAPRRTRGAEGGSRLEAARTVVEEDEAPRAVVPHRDIQVSVAIEVGERDGIAPGLFLTQPPRQREGGVPVVQEDPVLPGPVAAVGDDHVERPVAVHVAQADGGRQLDASAERPEGAEGALLAGEEGHAERGCEDGGGEWHKEALPSEHRPIPHASPPAPLLPNGSRPLSPARRMVRRARPLEPAEPWNPQVLTTFNLQPRPLEQPAGLIQEPAARQVQVFRVHLHSDAVSSGPGRSH